MCSSDLWSELLAVDLEPAWDFYSKTFGWTVVNDMDMGQMGTYRIFSDGDTTKSMGAGGMMTKPPMVPVPCWGFYFNVDGIQAAMERVKAAGGTIVNGPHQVPGGQWIVQGVDPQGANFALVSFNA